MKLAGYIVLVFLAAALESALPRLLFLDVARPLCVVVLVVHFARTLGTGEGAALSLFAGFVEDATAGFGTGLAAFACVVVFVVARVMFGGLKADGWLVETLFAGLAGLLWLATVTLVERLLGPPLSPFAAGTWLSMALWSSLATALASPLLLGAARRVERLEKRSAGAL